MNFTKTIQKVVICIATTIFISSCELPKQEPVLGLGRQSVTVLSKVNETAYRVLTENGDTITADKQNIINDHVYFKIGNMVTLDDLGRLAPMIDIGKDQKVFLVKKISIFDDLHKVILSTGDTLYVNTDVGYGMSEDFLFKTNDSVNMRYNSISNVIYPDR